jgi:hypothetical protein
MLNLAYYSFQKTFCGSLMEKKKILLKTKGMHIFRINPANCVIVS